MRQSRGRAARGRSGKNVRKVDVRHASRQRGRVDVIQIAQHGESEPLIGISGDVSPISGIASSVPDRPEPAIPVDLKPKAGGARLRPARGNGRGLHRGDERWRAHVNVGKVLFPQQ